MTVSLKEKASDSSRHFTIALDGPSASGKGLIGRMLAETYNLEYFQSSLVYRGLAHLCLVKNIHPDNAPDVIELSLYDQVIDYAKNYDLSDENIGNIASKISAISEVRTNLSRHLTELVKNSPRLIMEGRDIGTIIAPDADLKVFLTADVEQRAKRRYKQLKDAGKECIMREVLEQLKVRDARDMSRASAPLIPAKDALIIDTSDLSPEQVFEEINNFIQTK